MWSTFLVRHWYFHDCLVYLPETVRGFTAALASVQSCVTASPTSRLLMHVQVDRGADAALSPTFLRSHLVQEVGGTVNDRRFVSSRLLLPPLPRPSGFYTSFIPNKREFNQRPHNSYQRLHNMSLEIVFVSGKFPVYATTFLPETPLLDLKWVQR